MRHLASIAIACSLLPVSLACRRSVPVITTPVAALRTSPVETAASERFGRLFCGVLENHKADPGSWSYCASYFKPSGTPDAIPSDIPRNYRVLVVPGVFGQCVETYAQPFSDAKIHLLNDHGFNVEYVSVTALGSTKYNAQQIADYLAREYPKDPSRPYIVFGYSKGASDILEAIQTHAIARSAIRAVVSVAGSVLGSRLPDGVPPGILDALRQARMGTCDIGDGGGPDALRRAPRADAMTRLNLGTIRAFSIAAVATEPETRPLLKDGWRRLLAYSLEQDSQMIHEDAIVPGGAYLGIARGDHWAVALPFERMKSDTEDAKQVKRLFAYHDYPRNSLFEAALRFVIGELPVAAAK